MLENPILLGPPPPLPADEPADEPTAEDPTAQLAAIRAECEALWAQVDGKNDELDGERRKSLEFQNEISALQQHMMVDAVPFDEMLEMEERVVEAEAENDELVAQLEQMRIENQQLRDEKEQMVSNIARILGLRL
jgi:CII-binding regulator of phage lambda lysogenization HflD